MIGSEFTAGDLGIVIAATAAGLASIIGAIFAGVAMLRSGRNSLATEAVHQEVKTMNAQTIGNLADAAETRRIDEIAPKDRTQGEVDHLRAVPPVP